MENFKDLNYNHLEEQIIKLQLEKNIEIHNLCIDMQSRLNKLIKKAQARDLKIFIYDNFFEITEGLTRFTEEISLNKIKNHNYNNYIWSCLNKKYAEYYYILDTYFGVNQ